METVIFALIASHAYGESLRRVASQHSILLKNPLGRKILDFGGIKSPCLYRKNPSTGILERRFFVTGIRFF